MDLAMPCQRARRRQEFQDVAEIGCEDRTSPDAFMVFPRQVVSFSRGNPAGHWLPEASVVANRTVACLRHNAMNFGIRKPTVLECGTNRVSQCHRTLM